MTTIVGTLAAANAPIKAETGYNYVVGSAKLNGNTVSDGVVFNLCKLPDGAQVVDGWILAAMAGQSGGGEMNIGIGADEDSIIKSVSMSNSFHRFGTARVGVTETFPVLVDISDDVTDQFAILRATVGSGINSATNTGCIRFGIGYNINQKA